MSWNGAAGSSPNLGGIHSSRASCVTSSRATWSLRENGSVSSPRSANLFQRLVMKLSVSNALLAATLLLASTAWGQGGYGRPPSIVQYGPPAPRLPGVELTGPLDTALARVTLSLTADQSARYGQAYDSFMVATRPQRDSAQAAIGRMNERLDGGDRAAAMFYAEQLQDLGKYLRDRQDRFEDNLHRFLSGDQVKAYNKWREGEDQATERKRRADQLRWDEAGFRGEFGGPRASAPEIKTALPSPSAVAAPGL